MKNDSEFESRQIKTMKLLISDFKARKISINKFVVDQWPLLDLLERTSEKWIDDFRMIVNQIEDIYALSLDRGDKQLNISDTNTVDTLVEKLDLLIEEHKLNYNHEIQ